MATNLMPAGVGATNVGIVTPQKYGGLPEPFHIPVGGVIGSTLDIPDNAGFLAAYPSSLRAHLHRTHLLPNSDWGSGLFVFKDLSPSNLAMLSFVGCSELGDPENTTLVARVWAMRETKVDAALAEYTGIYLGALGITIGSVLVSGATPASLLHPVTANMSKWADTVTWTENAGILPGNGSDVGTPGRTGGSNTRSFATVDLLGCRTLIVAVGEGAAAPCDFGFPVLDLI